MAAKTKEKVRAKRKFVPVEKRIFSGKRKTSIAKLKIKPGNGMPAHPTIGELASAMTKPVLCAICGYDQWYQTFKANSDPFAGIRGGLALHTPMLYCCRCDAPIGLVFTRGELYEEKNHGTPGNPKEATPDTPETGTPTGPKTE